METSLRDLPPELVVRIIEYLPGQDIGRLSQTCSSIRDICQTDIIWMKLCLTVCEIDPVDWGSSWFDIYTRVLYRHGRCIGLWRREMEPYGGLVRVVVEEGKLIVREYQPPIVSNIHGPLRPKNVFSIGINRNTNETEILCLRGYFGPHIASVEFKEGTQDVIFRCCKMSCHDHPQGSLVEFLERVAIETDNLYTRSVPFTGYDKARLDCYIRSEMSYYLEPIQIQPPDPLYPIQPGLFLSHYSAHGIEIFLLNYDLEKSQAKLLKITGDPNVPSGQTSIFVLLNKPMNLTQEQQTDIDYIMNVDYGDIPDVDLKDLQPLNQPFLIPPSFDTFAGDFTVTTCKYRFFSVGQIAKYYYRDPEGMKVHLIVTETHLLAMWIPFRNIDAFIPVNLLYS